MTRNGQEYNRGHYDLARTMRPEARRRLNNAYADLLQVTEGTWTMEHLKEIRTEFRSARALYGMVFELGGTKIDEYSFLGTSRGDLKHSIDNLNRKIRTQQARVKRIKKSLSRK